MKKTPQLTQFQEDQLVIKTLRDEIAALKAEKERESNVSTVRIKRLLTLEAENTALKRKLHHYEHEQGRR